MVVGFGVPTGRPAVLVITIELLTSLLRASYSTSSTILLSTLLSTEHGSDLLECFDLFCIDFAAIDGHRSVPMCCSTAVEVHSRPLFDIISPFLSSLVSCTVQTVPG